MTNGNCQYAHGDEQKTRDRVMHRCESNGNVRTAEYLRKSSNSYGLPSVRFERSRPV